MLQNFYKLRLQISVVAELSTLNCVFQQNFINRTMSKFTFRYFDLRALGESPRILLAYGGQEFEDVRVQTEDWPAYKPKTKFGQMPILEIDGKQYAQSIAMSRYLGKKFGLGGATLEEDLEIDQVVDLVTDLRIKAAVAHYETDEEHKQKKYKELSTTIFPNLLNLLDSLVKENNGHLALGKLTWADFVLAGMYDYVVLMLRIPDVKEKYPNIKALVDKVYALPAVKAWTEKAPKSDF